jgi:DNA replicative helicase MCM subunit Mcm2 (Cdc46/Mcm family)
LQILAADEDNFSVDCAELFEACRPLYNNLVTYPREVIPILDDVVTSLARDLRAQAAAEGDASQAGLGDDTSAPINVRPYNLKEQRAIRDLDPNDIEALVQVDGMVTRVSNVTPDMRCGAPLCCRLRCRHLTQRLASRERFQCVRVRIEYIRCHAMSSNEPPRVLCETCSA